jgi:hypothetical protein
LYGVGECLRDRIEAECAVDSADAVTWHINVLRRRAHLAGIERERERNVARNGLDVGSGVDHDLIDACFLRVHLSLVCMAFEPGAILGAAGEVDQLDLRTQREILNQCAVVRVGREQGDDVWIETGFAQDVARDAHGNRQRKNSAGVRFDDDRVTGGQICEEAGVTVPRWEGAAAQYQTSAAWHDGIALMHRERRILSLWLFPVGISGDTTQLVPCVNDSFERAVLGVWAACLERHHEGLSGGVHDAVADLEGRAVDARQNLEAHADPCLRTGGAPTGLCSSSGGKQSIRVSFWVADAEREAKWRDFSSYGLAGRRLIELEGLIQVSLERRVTVGVRCFPVHFWTGRLSERAPVAARLDGGERLLQCVFVLGK